MKQSQYDFWHSRFSQVMLMIDMYADEMQIQAAAMNKEEYESKYFNKQQEEVRIIKSMKEIEGW